MSYWILPESGIPISVSIVQRLMNSERSTDEIEAHMKECDAKIKSVMESDSANLSHRLHNVETSKIIDHGNEGAEFFDDFTRFIDHVVLAHVDDIVTWKWQLRWHGVGSTPRR